jgi:hypothetical protein
MSPFSTLLALQPGYFASILENLEKMLAEPIGLDIVFDIKDCSGGNNSPSQHSLRRAVSFCIRNGLQTS